MVSNIDTSIKIKEKTVQKLNLLKYKLGAKSIDEVIERLLKIISHFKLAEELKEIGGKK